MDLGGEGRATGSAGPFIQLLSGGRPVRARCLMRRAPNPGGTTPRPRLYLLINIYNKNGLYNTKNYKQERLRNKV